MGKGVFWRATSVLLFWGAACGARMAQAQCITTFPYQEGFEAGPAWTAGGNASDWTWGTPNKPVISGPGEGTRSWVVGGLVGSFYSNGQQSWLESPCFDLSSLQYPWITFKLFWETERNYDGLGFQYSVNGGATWFNLGTSGSNSDCLTANWFNSQNIVGLNLAQPKQGWSGRVGATVGNCGGGAGSGGWVQASHCLSAVQGASNVKFRFVFGAGTICNGFDGIAVDDIRISEAPANQAAFLFACNGTTVEFQDASAQCPTSWSWSFGDPASGSANTASGAAVSHTFSAGGSYTVTLTVAGPCNAPSTVSRTLYIATPTATVEDPTCGGANGSISVTLPGAPPGLTYTWSPGGPGGPVLDGLSAGTYSLTVEGLDVCGFQESYTLAAAAPPLVVEVSAVPVSCHGGADGSATVAVTGGVPPYSYLWTPTGGDGPVADGLAAGTYTCTITDGEDCDVEASALIGQPAPLLLEQPAPVVVCPGATVTLVANASGGTAPYVFAWAPQGPVVTPSTASLYSATVTDANGCAAGPVEVQVDVADAVEAQVSITQALGCAPLCTTLSASGTGPGLQYAWDLGDGSASAVVPSLDHCFEEAGNYVVEVVLTDANGCSGSASTAVTVLPVPSAAFVAVPSVATVDDPRIAFRNGSTGAAEFLWQFGDGTDDTQRDPVHLYQGVGCYPVSLVVRSAEGCTDSAATVVCVEDAFVLWAPNAFTPNNDGFNDVFGVVTTLGATPRFQLTVFDRWGGAVHQSTALEQGWDGTANGVVLPDGIYAWTVEVEDRQGVLRKAQGHVVLLR